MHAAERFWDARPMRGPGHSLRKTTMSGGDIASRVDSNTQRLFTAVSEVGAVHVIGLGYGPQCRPSYSGRLQQATWHSTERRFGSKQGWAEPAQYGAGQQD